MPRFTEFQTMKSTAPGEPLRVWRVPSETSPEKSYVVSLFKLGGDEWHCTCRSFAFHGHQCKHVSKTSAHYYAEPAALMILQQISSQADLLRREANSLRERDYTYGDLESLQSRLDMICMLNRSFRTIGSKK